MVLLSGALNCDLKTESNIFLGMSNDLCVQGLEKVNYQIKQIDNNYLIYKSLLEKGIPILLLINTSALTHSNVFKGTNRNHCIVLIKENDATMEISDSFVRTIPMSVFHGDVDASSIRDEIQANRTSGIYVERQRNSNNQYNIPSAIFDHIRLNTFPSNKSIINILKTFCNMAIKNIEILFNKESLNDLAYEFKVAGMVTRFDYMMELFEKYLYGYQIDTESLSILKTKWELIASKLMKCSFVLNRDYYLKIFEVEIPILIDKEMHFYQETYKKMKSFNNRRIEQ